MKKKVLIASFLALSGALIVAGTSTLQAESPVEQCVRIMMSNRDECPYTLRKKRNLNDYQDIYNLAIKHPVLLKGIIHDGQSFAMLCVKRGHADVLERLINENSSVDLATPCSLYFPEEPQTTVLHQLLREVSKMRTFRDVYSEDYIAHITELTKLVIDKYPDLLDMPINKAKTARHTIYMQDNVSDLTCRNFSPNDNSIKQPLSRGINL